MSLSVIVIPCRNEPSINKNVRIVADYLSNTNIENIRIVVSTGDRETLNNFYSLEHYIVEFHTFGDSLERSILNGFSYALSLGAEKIVVLDADLCHPINKVPDMLALLNNYDMVVGSRYTRGGKYSSTLFRKFVTVSFKTFASLKGSLMSDPMSGFFGIRASILKSIKFKPITWKTCLEIELYHRSHNKQIKIYEMPISFDGERADGLPKSGSKVAIKLLKDLVTY